ncbi:hypothetical protein J41TS12_00870 [Paenibacillus antibioticophila]|uniref:Uncharacterized protein n=1 Tax=Paenibacillus antibioticophila TaxID=1274374 RepID=A0A919XLJ8_9BACL|nr:hypothetical protein [Paenibacillus antibioticophila]GIO35226.1 hypothetical protein J41TS12_00870 [Paenibacillus antibioticophila]
MKTAWKYTAAAVVIGGSLWAGSMLNLTAEGASVTSQPGSSDDPVVTKSYVDQAIQQALKGGGTTTPSTPSTGGNTGGSAEAVEIVTVKPGETLIAGAGAEFVVRAGKAVIYSSDSNGVADLTDGVDIKNGGTVANNHLLSFPREGRGIQVLEGNKYSLTVMVRGSYSIR